jgi:hypothetical protein
VLITMERDDGEVGIHGPLHGWQIKQNAEKEERCT